MGKATRILMRTMKGMGRGSDYFGVCELCKQRMSECFTSTPWRVYEREDETCYLSRTNGSTYGHASCLVQAFGEHGMESATLRKSDPVAQRCLPSPPRPGQ